MRPLMLEVGLIVDGQFLSKGEDRYQSLAVEASVKALANTLSTAKRRSRNARYMLIPLTQVRRDPRLRGATNLSQDLEGVPREVRR